MSSGPGDRRAEEAVPEASAAASLSEVPSNGELLMRLLRFQFKLALDGLRDVVLSPIAIGAVILGIPRAGRPDEPFEAVLRFGRRSDIWIDLFESHAHDASSEDAAPAANASALFGAVESALRDEYEKSTPRAHRGARGQATDAPGDEGSSDRESGRNQ